MHSSTSPQTGDRQASLMELRKAIEHAAHYLPAQGPITVFVHHNTLHALEDLHFDNALKEGARLFGCQTYLSEERYRELLGQDRIRVDDLSQVLLSDLDERADGLIGSLGTRYFLRLAMLRHPLRSAPSVELRWLVAESDALRTFRKETPEHSRQRVIKETRHWVMRDVIDGRSAQPDEQRHDIWNSIADLVNNFGESRIENWSDSTWESFCLHMLWRVCVHGVHGIKKSGADVHSAVRHRDLLFEATTVDADQIVHETLIRFCAAFLDQGLARWALPNREDGFYRAFQQLYKSGFRPADRGLSSLSDELHRLHGDGIGPLESIDESLDLLGVSHGERDKYISATLLALRGWAGMIWQMETRGDRVIRPAPIDSLIEFLAVRLILERIALASVARDTIGFDGHLSDLRRALRSHVAKQSSVSVEQRAFLVFQLAQVLGWLPADLYRLTKHEWSMLVEELEAFSSTERRRIYQLAFERRYRNQALDAISVHAARAPYRNPRPGFQVICCIDDREESFRRHLEEIEPACETMSAAGFFAVPMYYRGAADAAFVPLCPIVVRPQHWVDEDVVYTFEELHRLRTQARRMLGTATHRLHVGSRSFALGALLTTLFGPLASIPLIARVLFPRLTARIRRKAGQLVETPPVTQLRLERFHSEPGPAEEQIGFTVPEMAGMVEKLLRELGLTSHFARLVIVFGHGSSSFNNPHESAYNCGACAGARGGPNARAFAHMANDPRVRELLARKDLAVPRDVVFVGAFHNTCDDSVTYFDLDRVPVSHKADFDRAKQAVDRARERNAHERCRRFESAPLNLSPEAALRHVEGRAEDLAQTRPEYNHATNALCIVGRRARTRGLFLDRRSFLNSYDPTQDDEQQTILTRILRAAVPVCAGISLEYYFSTVDPNGFGCGTKLPHNLTSMLGVMDGAASDLRTGLSSQMIEIHEPLRLLFIIETTPDAMLSIMHREVGIAKLVRNEWVQLAVLDPDSSQIQIFRNGKFVMYKPESHAIAEVESSVDWYRGWRDHLSFAVIRKGLSPQEKSPLMEASA